MALIAPPKIQAPNISQKLASFFMRFSSIGQIVTCYGVSIQKAILNVKDYFTIKQQFYIGVYP